MLIRGLNNLKKNKIMKPSEVKSIRLMTNCTQLTKTVSGVSGVVSNGSQWCN